MADTRRRGHGTSSALGVAEAEGQPVGLCHAGHGGGVVAGTMASYSLILYVMRRENVSYIVALRQTSVLSAVLVGRLALKEGYGRIRLMASASMLVGFYLVATAR